MRKRIGVFIGEITADYQRTISKSVFAVAKQYDYDVIEICSYGMSGNNYLYAKGERNMMNLPDLSAFAGIILCEDTYDVDSMEKDVEALLREKATCPVVSLRRQVDDFYSIVIQGVEPMAQITRHFVYDHGFRDICFMQGPMIYSDAIDRYKGFTDVCAEAGIEITEHMVFEGDFWRFKGKEAVDWFLEGRTDYPQAIICANDYMALAVTDELKRRKIRVPEDICVSGYDDIMLARMHFPAITSMAVPFEEMAEKAVQIIHNVNNKIAQEKTTWVTPCLHLADSCGCAKQDLSDDVPRIVAKMEAQRENIKQIVFMNSECQDMHKEEDYLHSFAYYFRFAQAKKGFLCLCTADENTEDDPEFTYFSDEMVLKRIYFGGGSEISCETRFKRADILPEQYMEEEPGLYLVVGIHHKSDALGYLVLEYDEDSWIDEYMQSYVMSIASAIDEVRVQNQIEGLQEIHELYMKDALTGIYNRRGFERGLKQMMDYEKENGGYLSVASIDMDGLKYINDNFGHAEGDFALQTIAGVLQSIMKENEICARVGGDEFNAVLYAQNPIRHLEFTLELERELKKVSNASEKPYPIGASVGVCCITKQDKLTLIECMEKADAEMYRAKRQRKKERGYV